MADETPESSTTFEFNTICFTCDKAWERADGHDCPMRDKLTPLEHMMVGALLAAEFCDHYCCDLTPNACKAKAIAHYLKEHELLKADEDLTPVLKDYGLLKDAADDAVSNT